MSDLFNGLSASDYWNGVRDAMQSEHTETENYAMSASKKLDLMKKYHKQGKLILCNCYWVRCNGLSLYKFNNKEVEHAHYFEKNFEIKHYDNVPDSTVKPFIVTNKKKNTNSIWQRLTKHLITYLISNCCLTA